MARIKQEPKIKGNWLFHDEPNGSRLFSDYILIEEGYQLWLECTNEEKLAWEEAHKVEELEPIEQ
jgi:hypothetical protein